MSEAQGIYLMTNDLGPARHNGVSDLLERTIKSVAEGLVGIASSDRKDLILSVGHILLRLRGGSFLSAFKKEWDAYRDKGRIPKDFEQSDENWDCLQEMLDFIDRDIPDTRRFGAMKNLYLNIAVNSASDASAVNNQQLMRVCRSLSSGELIVLLNVYKLGLRKTAEQWGHQSAASWVRLVAEESGLYTGLVEVNEGELIKKGLLFQRTHADRSGVALGQHFRVTDVGVALCKWMAEPPSYIPD